MTQFLHTVLLYEISPPLSMPGQVLHPLLCTRPVDWPYHVPYGILYAKAPSPAVAGFLDILRQLSPPNAAAT